MSEFFRPSQFKTPIEPHQFKQTEDPLDEDDERCVECGYARCFWIHEVPPKNPINILIDLGVIDPDGPGVNEARNYCDEEVSKP